MADEPTPVGPPNPCYPRVWSVTRTYTAYCPNGVNRPSRARREFTSVLSPAHANQEALRLAKEAAIAGLNCTPVPSSINSSPSSVSSPYSTALSPPTSYSRSHSMPSLSVSFVTPPSSHTSIPSVPSSIVSTPLTFIYTSSPPSTPSIPSVPSVPSDPSYPSYYDSGSYQDTFFSSSPESIPLSGPAPESTPY